MESIDVKRGLSIVIGICMLAAAGLGAMTVTVQMRSQSQTSESTQESEMTQKKESEKTAVGSDSGITVMTEGSGVSGSAVMTEGSGVTGSTVMTEENAGADRDTGESSSVMGTDSIVIEDDGNNTVTSGTGMQDSDNSVTVNGVTYYFGNEDTAVIGE
ncbi:MAG: hypothetical protein SOX32_00610 [Candidatus Choladocola sp.]|nr:hypothetical protein [Candidatus Choladocola sp.]